MLPLHGRPNGLGSWLTLILLAVWAIACTSNGQNDGAGSRLSTPSPSPVWGLTATMVPAPTQTPAPAPGPTDCPVQLPQVKFVAVILDRRIDPPDGSRGWPEFSIEVYEPPEPEPVFRLSREGVSYGFAAFSPDGQWMAYVEDRKDLTTGIGQARVRLISTDWQIDRPLTDWLETSRWGTWVRRLLWSPSGQWLAFQHYKQGNDSSKVYIVNVDTGDLRLVGDDVRQVAWSPYDPARLAFFSRGPTRQLYLVTVDDLKHPQEVGLPEVVYPATLVWRPDGTQLILCACRTYACQTPPALWLVDVGSLSAAVVYGDAPRCGGFAWSSDGLWLANSGGESGGSNAANILYYSTADWKTVRKQPGEPGEGVEWAGDGILLYSEVTNMEGGPGTGQYDSHRLVAGSMQGFRQVVWDPRDVGLPERIQGKFDFFGIVWYVSVCP